MDENNKVPAAGEQVIFDEVKPAEAPQSEVSQPQAEMPQSEISQPQAEAPQSESPQPQAEAPQSEIPQVEQPQQQYQQTPPPNNYQYQNHQYQNQQQYNPVPPNPVTVEPETKPMTLGDWLVTLLLMMIPCVNIILLFVWAFGDMTGNLNRKNYAKAELIIFGVIAAIYLIVVIIMAIAIGVSWSY